MAPITSDKKGEKRAIQWLKGQVCNIHKIPPTRNYLRQFSIYPKRAHHSPGIRSGVPHEKAWREVPYHQRLLVTEHFFIQLNRATSQGGVSFRRFIYNMLGFNYNAYAPLYLAGGMKITNMILENIIYKCKSAEKGYI